MSWPRSSNRLRERESVFADRDDAGRQLGALVQPKVPADGLLLAIPSGGVPVAAAMRSRLAWPLELLLVRKIQIPWNTEAGFGAINLDGDRLFNRSLLESLHLSEEMVESQVKKAWRTVEQRNALFRGDRPFPDLRGKDVILIDDGLASGYTMLAAVRFAKRRQPASLAVAVPTGLQETLLHLADKVERIYCANIRTAYPFAVASAYRNWHDLDDEEVLGILGRPPKD